VDGLAGANVTIRGLEEHDVDALMQLVHDDEVAKQYYGELELPRSRDDIRARVLGREAAFSRFAIATSDHPLIGVCGVAWLAPPYRRHHTCRVSVMIGRAHQHHGYGYEARILLCDRLFAQFNVHRIIGGYLSDNTASARQAERTGALVCGTLRQEHFYDGRFHDITAWCLTPERFYAACGNDLPARSAAPA
jgi:RimJ/RimL family protein N-acetyltransferase